MSVRGAAYWFSHRVDVSVPGFSHRVDVSVPGSGRGIAEPDDADVQISSDPHRGCRDAGALGHRASQASGIAGAWKPDIPWRGGMAGNIWIDVQAGGLDVVTGSENGDGAMTWKLSLLKQHRVHVSV